MIKRELYLVKKNKNFDNVYVKEHIHRFHLDDITFIQKALDLGYDFLKIETEIYAEFIGGKDDLIMLTGDRKETIISPKEILNGSVATVEITPTIIESVK